MNNKILAIAITEYDDKKLNKISNCKNDLDNILKVLTTKYQFEDVEFIFEKHDTSRKNLFNKLKFYFANCLEDENVLLLFSGHGQYDEILNITYWQPSDSDCADSSTWFNLTELMAFIKASKAHHISIISDSCFSGAMFDTFRGGGIDALDKKKSRIGFTSGSIEPVSDGPKGELSPFAKALINELEINNEYECPLSTIATNLILNFDKTKNQTPVFAPFSNVGHGGGIFILKLKENGVDIPQNIGYLKDKYKSTFIPVQSEDITFDELKALKDDKKEAIKKQDYLKARILKDTEETLKQKINDDFEKFLKTKNQNIQIPDETKTTLEKYDKEYERLLTEIPQIKEKINEQILKNDAKKIYFRGKNYGIEDSDDLIDILIYEKANGSYINYFSKYKADFIKKFNSGIIDLYLYFKEIKGNSKAKYLIEKEENLIKIIKHIYDSEINFLLANSIDEIEFMIEIRNNELLILNWIQ